MRTTRRCAPFLLFALAIMLAPMTASAAISFQASDTLGVNVFQQQQDSPCVIGDQSCKQPSNFFYNNNSSTPGGGQGSTYDLLSPTYVAATNSTPFNYSGDRIPTTFTIGVDENISTGQGAEALVFFKTYVCPGPVSTANNGGTTGPAPAGCTLDSANSYTPATPTTIPDEHNGNGFSDFILTGFSLTAGTFYRFEASVSNDTDGMEEFFIIPSGHAPFVPEPASILMLGTTLIGIGAITRRRLNRKNAC